MLFLTILVFSVCAFGNGIPLQKTPVKNSTDNLSKYFDSRIIGGTDAAEGSATFMVALVFGEGFTVLACGGSIVSRKLILTAAQCIDMYLTWGELIRSYHGVVGSNRWNSSGYPIYFKGFNMHPQWDRGSLLNDIGFLLVDRDLTWSSTVGMIGMNLERIPAGEQSVVYGWGALNSWPNNVMPEKLQRLNLRTLSDESCIAAFRQLHIEIYPDYEICAFHSVGHGLCNGDAGSPLISLSTNTVIGLGTWGIPCGEGKPDVYTRLSGMTDFIRAMLYIHQ